MIIGLPFLSRADEWEQAPSGGDGGKGQTTAPSGNDDQTIADFLAQIRAPHAGGHAVCEVVGMFANVAAVARDQGSTEPHQLTEIDSNFDRAANARHIPHEWVRPIKDVVHREVAYVYDHPGMSADQVKSEWIGMCESQRNGR